MPLSALLPIAGVAAAALAREAVVAVGSGLSFATELVRQGRAGEAASADAAAGDGPNQFATALAQFAKRIGQRLAAAGLKLSGPVELAADGLGGIEVNGAEQDRNSVEQLLAADESLRDQFHALAEQHQSQGSGSRHDFGLSIDGDHAEVVAR